MILVGDTGWRLRIRQFVPAEQALFRGRRETAPLYGHAAGGKINELVECATLRYQLHSDCAAFITVITLEDPNGQVLLKNGSQIHSSDIAITKGQTGIQFGKEEIRFCPRRRFYPNAEVTLEGELLRLAFPSREDCQYAFYLLNAKTGRVVYKGNYKKWCFYVVEMYSNTSNIYRTFP